MMTEAQRGAWEQAVHHGAHPVAALHELDVTGDDFLDACVDDQDFCNTAFFLVLTAAIVVGVKRFSAELEEFTTE